MWYQATVGVEQCCNRRVSTCNVYAEPLYNAYRTPSHRTQYQSVVPILPYPNIIRGLPYHPTVPIAGQRARVPGEHARLDRRLHPTTGKCVVAVVAWYRTQLGAIPNWVSACDLGAVLEIK